MKEFFINHYMKIGWAIAILNLIMIINSTWFFLGMLKFSVIAWLYFNACAPSVVIYLVGFFSGRREIMAASMPSLFFFGGVGLFVFSWSGTSLVPQAGHILMVTAIVYTAMVTAMEKIWKKTLTGFIIGLVFFAIFLPFQQRYVKEHPEYVKKLGDPAFEELINKNRGN